MTRTTPPPAPSPPSWAYDPHRSTPSPSCSTRAGRCRSSPGTARRRPARSTRSPSPRSGIACRSSPSSTSDAARSCSSLTERALLTDELAAALRAAPTLSVLEDLYLPYRPKRRTRATVARERGLEPLARRLFAQDPQDRFDPADAARAFVDPDLGVPTVDDALAGARDVIAEWVSEDAAARAGLRALFVRRGAFRSQVAAARKSTEPSSATTSTGRSRRPRLPPTECWPCSAARPRVSCGCA